MQDAVNFFWDLPTGYITDHNDQWYYAVEFRLRFFSNKWREEKTIYSSFDKTVFIENDDIPAVVNELVDLECSFF